MSECRIISLAIARKKHECCHHELIDIDLQGRTITCRICNSIVDPFEWIVERARDEAFAKWQVDEHKKYLAEARRKAESARLRRAVGRVR